MARLRLTGFLRCRTLEEADRIAPYLDDHVRLTRAEPGCLQFEVLRSAADPACFAVSETYVDAEALEAHRVRAAGTIWARVTAGIPRDYTVTEIDDEAGE
ncbi:MAG: antibiotic biosynthesis monooxygenase [Rhodobacteraceae bacterium]|nr:antibiotic biosynthesis monooxygenase [Paracoccaceae bacterium]